MNSNGNGSIIIKFTEELKYTYLSVIKMRMSKYVRCNFVVHLWKMFSVWHLRTTSLCILPHNGSAVTLHNNYIKINRWANSEKWSLCQAENYSWNKRSHSLRKYSSLYFLEDLTHWQTTINVQYVKCGCDFFDACTWGKTGKNIWGYTTRGQIG